MQQDPSQPSEASQFPYQQPPPPPQYTQYPTQPYPLSGMPPPPPPKPKQRIWLWIVVGAIAVIGFIGYQNNQNALQQTPTSTQATPVATQAPATTAPTPIPATPTTDITPTPTQVTQFAATHGKPHIGGPFSDFVGKYGQPIGQGSGNSYNFQSDTPRSDGSLPPGPNVTPNAAGMVIGLDIVSDGATTVSFDQARLHCEVWLPSDAVEFNRAPPYIDYHSSVGEIVMMVNDFGDCVLSIAQS